MFLAADSSSITGIIQLFGMILCLSYPVIIKRKSFIKIQIRHKMKPLNIKIGLKKISNGIFNL